jgi:TPR repeat protein
MIVSARFIELFPPWFFKRLVRAGFIVTAAVALWSGVPGNALAKPETETKTESDKAAGGVGAPGSYGDAMRWYERSAKAGNARAQFYLGMLYLRGRRGAPDPAAAAAWFEKAAAQGHHQAQLKLGLMYYEGEGVARSYEKAAALFERASSRSAQAAYNFASMLERGLGVGKNPARAAEVFETAVARGIEEAALHLAVLYGQDDKKTDDKKTDDTKPPAAPDAGDAGGADKDKSKAETEAEAEAEAKTEPGKGAENDGGNDVPQDRIKALMWLTWAAEKGLGPDPAFRAALVAGMSEDDIAEATKLALERLKN